MTYKTNSIQKLQKNTNMKNFTCFLNFILFPPLIYTILVISLVKVRSPTHTSHAKDWTSQVWSLQDWTSVDNLIASDLIGPTTITKIDFDIILEFEFETNSTKS